MNNNKENKTTQRPPTTKNTWIMLIILSFVVIGISIYQMNSGTQGGSIDYLTILLSVIVIIASLFNIFKKKK